MPTTDLTKLPADELAAELARREAAVARQQAEAVAAWQAEQASRARVVLDGWKAKEQGLLASAAEAEAAFREAVLADPVMSAYMRVRWHRYRRNALRTEAQTAAHLLGESQTAERIAPLNDWGSRFIDDASAVIEAEAQQLAYDESQTVVDHLQNQEG